MNNNITSPQALSTQQILEEKPHDKFWLEDYRVLFENGKYTIFFPTANMNNDEKLNALTRFSVYLAFLLFFFGNYDNSTWLYLPLVLVFLGIFLYKLDEASKPAPPQERRPTTAYESAGYFEKDFLDEQRLRPADIVSSVPESDIKKPCRRPTLSNPYMNVVLSDFVDDPQRPQACDENDPDVNKEAIKKFNEYLYRDVNDLY